MRQFYRASTIEEGLQGGGRGNTPSNRVRQATTLVGVHTLYSTLCGRVAGDHAYAFLNSVIEGSVSLRRVWSCRRSRSRRRSTISLTVYRNGAVLISVLKNPDIVDYRFVFAAS